MESTAKKKKQSVQKVCLIILLGIFLCLGIGAWCYVEDYYRASDVAIQYVSDATYISGKDAMVFTPKEPTGYGFIFYPGGKVQCEAYAPLLSELADRGIQSILIKMPANLAVLNPNAADGIQEKFPEIEHWYIGGHSLGGAMAASYIYKHQDAYDGLVLLAAYSTEDLSQSDLQIVSIYGSEDQVLNAEKYQKMRPYLGNQVNEHIIQGGCHAYFGSYGSQKGDGVPTISEEEQVRQTVDVVIDSIIR